MELLSLRLAYTLDALDVRHTTFNVKTSSPSLLWETGGLIQTLRAKKFVFRELLRKAIESIDPAVTGSQIEGDQSASSGSAAWKNRLSAL